MVIHTGHNRSKTEQTNKGEIRKIGKKLQMLTQEQTVAPKTHHSFYPTVVNKSNITFTNEENTLLNKGLKYNLHRKKGKWLTNLALEVETSINLLTASRQTVLQKTGI